MGAGGSNVHVILDSAASVLPPKPTQNGSSKGTAWQLIPISANSATSLQDQIKAFTECIKANPDVVHDLAYTLGCRRDHLSHRSFLVTDGSASSLTGGPAPSHASPFPSLTFVFTGQGALWPGTGKALMEYSKQFGQSLESMDAALQRLPDPPTWSIENLLDNPQEATFDDPELAQPLCTAIQLGLVNIFSTWGVRPDSVVGHSSGEIAAAYAAGAISADLAIILSYYRGKAIKSNSPPGAMAAVGLGIDTISPFLGDQVVMACENSPNNVTLSGEEERLDSVLEKIAAEHPDVSCQRLHVKTAYHSHLLETAATEYEKQITPHLAPNGYTIKPMYSSILGRKIDRTGDLDAAYWRQTITSPVLFNTAVTQIVSDSKTNRLFVEIGPHSALLGPLREIFNSCKTDFEMDYTPSLIREQDGLKSLLSTAGNLYARQIPLDMSAVNGGSGTLLTNLPPYSWQHDKVYWYENRASRAWKYNEHPPHELLGSRTLESTDREPSWRNCLNVESVPWIMDHDIAGEIVFPCAGYISMLGEAIGQLTGMSGYMIRELFIRSAMVMERRSITEIVTSLKPVQLTDIADSSWYEFTVSSYDGKDWQKHCVGQIKGGDRDADTGAPDTQPFARKIDTEAWYKTMADHGVKYGEHFQRLCNISSNPLSYEALADIKVDESAAATYPIHPTAIDQAFQLLGVASCKGLSRNLQTLGVPFSIEEVYIATPATTFALKAKFPESRDGSLDIASGGTMTATSNGKLAFQLKGAKFFPLRYQASEAETAPLGSRVEWKTDIDLLPSSKFVQPSFVKTKQIGLVAKMVIMALEQMSQSMGVASLDSALRVKLERLMEENVTRIRENLQSILPNEDDWSLDLGACGPKFLRDITSAIKSSDPVLKPMRNFMKTFVEMMEGRIQPLAWTLQDTGLHTVYDFSSTLFYLGQALTLTGHSNPALRVLEISGDTCGSTAAVLSSLYSKESVSLFSRFVFATQSPQLLEDAKERFAGIEEFEAQLLDFNEDATTQGLERESFDLIIAPNDLAGQSDLSKSLPSIMGLLKPGGRFVVHEITPPIPAADYFMALPLVASLFGDRLSTKVPYPPEFWTDALKQHGFEDVYSYASAQFGNSWSAKVTISSIKPMLEHAKGDIDLICIDESHKWVQSVSQKLQDAGYKPRFHTMNTVPEASTNAIVLLDLEEAFLEDISTENYDALMKYLAQHRRTLWIHRPAQMSCSDPSHGLILGLLRTARYEAGRDFATLEIDALDRQAAEAVVKVYEKVVRQPSVGNAAPDAEFALQNGVVHVARFHWMELAQSSLETRSGKSKGDDDRPVALTIGNPPSFETLCWKHVKPRELGPNEVEIDIHVVGLNFRDIMVSAGVISDGQGLGLEASGVVRQVGADVKSLQPGDKVSTMGSGLLCTRAIVPEEHCFPVPDGVSLDDAATMPVAHSTASYSLQIVGQLERDQTVLIHSAAGAVGQAAIQICQAVGAKVFATVSSELKTAYLAEAYNIPREDIFHSRDASFVANVLRATDGKGCDIVLNSLSGELLHESWKCVADFGKMIELGKRDFVGHGSLKMQPFGANRSFVGVDMLKIAGSPERFKKVQGCIAILGRQRKIRPIYPVRKFAAAQVQQALVYMQRGTHLGKILIDMKSDEAGPTVDSDDVDVMLSPDASYLIVGGLGGIGRAVCSWMVERGAEHLTLLSRSAGASEDDQAFLHELGIQGCEATTVAGNVSKIEDVERAIASSPKQIRGVIHLGMVLKPNSLLKCPLEDWQAVQSPKVHGAWNLHNALSTTKLDFFIVFSSITSLCGAVGMANYASANAFLDSFVKYRRSLKLPAAGVNLGAVGDIGCFRQMPDLITTARASGVRFLNESEVLQSLHVALKMSQESSHERDSALETSQVIAGMSTNTSTPGTTFRPAWSEDARFRLYTSLSRTLSSNTSIHISDDEKVFLDMAKTHPEQLQSEAAEATLLRVIARRVIGPDADEVQQRRFAGMLVDSLVAVEVMGWLRRNLGLEIRMSEVAGVNTMEAFCKLALRKVRERKMVRGEEGE